MNTHSAPPPDGPSASGGESAADGDDLLAPGQRDAAGHPGGLTGRPDSQQAPGQAGDDETGDEYEPL